MGWEYSLEEVKTIVEFIRRSFDGNLPLQRIFRELSNYIQDVAESVRGDMEADRVRLQWALEAVKGLDERILWQKKVGARLTSADDIRTNNMIVDELELIKNKFKRFENV